MDSIVIQSYQQRRSEVKVLEELGDEDVDVDHAVLVHLLHLPQDVDQPLKVPLAARDPDKVQLQEKSSPSSSSSSSSSSPSSSKP